MKRAFGLHLYAVQASPSDSGGEMPRLPSGIDVRILTPVMSVATVWIFGESLSRRHWRAAMYASAHSRATNSSAIAGARLEDLSGTLPNGT